MTHIPKHHSKQEGECNDGVHRCRGMEGKRWTYNACNGNEPFQSQTLKLQSIDEEVCRRTWIDFPVAGHSVGINNVLETSCERVDGEEGRWSAGVGQAVVERVNTTSTLPLKKEKPVGKR